MPEPAFWNGIFRPSDSLKPLCVQDCGFWGAGIAGCWDMAAEDLQDAKNSIYVMHIFPVDIMTTLCNTINDYRM